MRQRIALGFGLALTLASAGAVALATFGSEPSAAIGTAAQLARRTPADCTVTLPNRKHPPATATATLPPVPPAFHGNGKLWVKLWPFGVIVARPNVIQADGSIAIKLPWWRNVSGALTVTAVRLDAHAPAATSDVPAGYGSHGFQPSDVVFPTQGCWKITGRVRTASLAFVVLVIKAQSNGY